MPGSIYGPGTRRLHVARKRPEGRRYYLPNGAVIIVAPAGHCTLLAAWCNKVDIAVSRRSCAKALRDARASLRAA